MNSKERVLMAINHQEADKVPLDCWPAPEITEALTKLLKPDLQKDPWALQKELGHDLLMTGSGISDCFAAIYKEEKMIGDNLFESNWGIKVKRQYQRYGSYAEFVEHPLADLKNYDDFKWPDFETTDKEGLEQTKKLLDISAKDYAVLAGVPCTIFEASWYLRGLENFLMDLYLKRDFANELLEKTMRYHLELSKKLVSMGVDIIWWGDDIANELGPYFDPKLYRELIKPKYCYMVDEVKKINPGIKTAYHSDGKIEWALDDFAEIGFDILNPIQPDVNDVAMIKKKYGKKFTFWGNVDTRKVMGFGTCSEVAEEVKKVINLLGPGGGLILCSNHAVQATERAVDNTIAYYWAAEKFRNYPLI